MSKAAEVLGVWFTEPSGDLRHPNPVSPDFRPRPALEPNFLKTRESAARRAQREGEGHTWPIGHGDHSELGVCVCVCELSDTAMTWHLYTIHWDGWRIISRVGRIWFLIDLIRAVWIECVIFGFQTKVFSGEPFRKTSTTRLKRWFYMEG